MTDTEYVDNLELIANTPAWANSLLHNLMQWAGGIGLYVGAIKLISCVLNK